MASLSGSLFRPLFYVLGASFVLMILGLFILRHYQDETIEIHHDTSDGVISYSLIPSSSNDSSSNKPPVTLAATTNNSSPPGQQQQLTANTNNSKPAPGSEPWIKSQEEKLTDNVPLTDAEPNIELAPGQTANRQGQELSQEPELPSDSQGPKSPHDSQLDPESSITQSDDRKWWSPANPITHYGISDWSKEGSSWTAGFCKEFLVDTFDKSSDVCSGKNIVCYGTKHNRQIGYCELKNLAVKPKDLYNEFAVRRFSGMNAWLEKSTCNEMNFQGIDSYMEKPDPFHSLVKVIARQTSQQEKCDVWVKGTSFFYMGVGDHIYFKMLGWYNLHRSLLQHEDSLTSFTIVRLPESKSPFKFKEFEKTLFPQSVGMEEFTESVVCFENAVFVPWTYAATPFRCKMDGNNLKRQCMNCDGKGRETDLLSFRRRILSACSLNDGLVHLVKTKRKFLVVQRKQYIRRLGDSHGKFQRVWTNSKELIAALKNAFPNDEVNGIFGEDLEMCAQVQIAHEADIFIGMHGAGMVHLWWLREGTISFELVPSSQRGNGAFSTLSKLLGKTHHQYHGVTERGSIVTVNINHFINEIKSKI